MTTIALLTGTGMVLHVPQDAYPVPQTLGYVAKSQSVDISNDAVMEIGPRDSFSSEAAPPPPPPEPVRASFNIPDSPAPIGEAQAYAASLVSADQFGCLVELWNRESGWRTNAANPSGAYGIPQALPGEKMASAGEDWMTSYVTQINWGMGYINGRYGSPCGAWEFFLNNNWY